MTRYDWSRLQEARRMLAATLPASVTVNTIVSQQGLGMCIALAASGSTSCTYEFGWTGREGDNPGKPLADFSAADAHRIASDWFTGKYLPQARPIVEKAAPTLRVIATADALTDWVSHARRGDVVVYHKGNLARFRHEAPAEIVYLQRQLDGRKGKRDGLGGIRMRLTKLQEQLELISRATKMYNAGLITYSQRRDPITNETIYLATRLGANAMNATTQQSPASQSVKIQTEIRNAIKNEWYRYRKDFEIAHISFDGHQDKIHDTTALVEIFSHDRQKPTHIRIPLRDLGENRAHWPDILAQKGKNALKQIKARDGLNRGRKSLDDLPG